MSRVTIVALAWALIHFIWQGAAIALVAGIVTAGSRRARPAARYAVLCGALGAMLLAPAVTFAVLRLPPAAASAAMSVPGGAALAAARLSAIAPGLARSASSTLEATPWLEWVVGIWLSGVAILGVRSLGGWWWAQRLSRRGTSPASPEALRFAFDLREQWGIRRAVRILSSAVAEVPATIGWLRPVVLLPVSVFTALTPEQIELLIAHELAHVRRHDYLVNLAQTAVETVLFYHPAVWWISGRIRLEREDCCDDLAVAACGNVVHYVKALAALEGLRVSRHAMVLAADGGSLLHRIRRLVGAERSERRATPGWLGLASTALVLAAVLSAPAPRADIEAPPKTKAPAVGFLGELSESGYPRLSVDEIIALKDHGVQPCYVKEMLQAGMGVPGVRQMISLHDHGVEPDFAASLVKSGLVSDLDVANVIRLREHDAQADDMGRIRALGFGPFSTSDVIRLRDSGVDDRTFEALKEAGAVRAGVADAIVFRQNDVTTERIRDMKRQGFRDLSLEQILKLRRAGII